MTRVFEIGPFRLEAGASVLMRDGVAAPLGPRAVAVLSTLVERANEYVPKQNIIDMVWPGVVVEESNLPVQIVAIRRALAEGGGKDWIETLPRRGYRFVGPVRDISERRSAQYPTPDDHRSNLPEPLTSFIGRERDLADIKRSLPDCRLLTLVGIGGIGKTRLALQAAADLVDVYRDGVWFVDLGPLLDPALVPAEIAEVLRVREKTGKPLVDALCAFLKRRRLLLILDNCEHLLPACASMAVTLLRHAAELTIIATSREPLRIDGERTYLLDSLSLPNPAGNAQATESSDAVRLFVERAQRHQPGFALTPVRTPIVAQLCIHLDGIPLALELAAARIRSLSLEQIHARLDNRFRLLTDGGRSALPRQQTLRAMLDWSFDLLDEEERVVLRRVAAFAGGFTLEAATDVACDARIDSNAAIDILGQLVLRSLVIAATGDSHPRYRLLETTRAYALEKLVESGELDAIRRRHAEFCCELFAHASDDWNRLPDAEWHAIYLPELDNVRAALAWALGPAGDGSVAITLAGVSRRLWKRLSGLEGRQWFSAALDRVGESTPLADQAQLWYGLGSLRSTSEPSQTVVALERAIALYRQLGDALGLGKALRDLGRVWAFMGRFDQANAALEEAQPLLERSALPKSLGRYFETLAFLKMLTGDLASARENFERSLSLFQTVAADSSMLAILLNLADMTWALGDLDAALARFSEAVALIRKSSSAPKEMLGFGLTNLAGVYTERGDVVQALAAAREGLLLRREENLEGAIDHLALRAALAGAFENAARLAGYTDHIWAAKKSTRQPNEVRARSRLQALLREKLATVEIERLRADGAKLTEEEACRIALDDAHAITG